MSAVEPLSWSPWPSWGLSLITGAVATQGGFTARPSRRMWVPSGAQELPLPSVTHTTDHGREDKCRPVCRLQPLPQVVTILQGTERRCGEMLGLAKVAQPVNKSQHLLLNPTPRSQVLSMVLGV